MDLKQINKAAHLQDRVYGSDGISPSLNTVSGGGQMPYIEVKEKPCVIDTQGRKGKKPTPKEQAPALRANAHGNVPMAIVKNATKYGGIEIQNGGGDEYNTAGKQDTQRACD